MIQSLQTIAESESGIEFKNKDSIVLCHVTDGTVDLISYEITRLIPFINLKESTSSFCSGGLHGWNFVTRRFAKYLSTKIGSESGWDAEVEAEAIYHFDLLVS